jgi:polyribonucleotide nucleotidyltransferase
MKTKEVKTAYEVLNNAKLTKLETSDKFKVIKALREFKGIANAYDDFLKDAQEKLKGENHDEIVKKAQQWQSEGEKTTLTIEERAEINKYLNDYNNKVVECLKEEAEKDNDLSFDKLSEESFGKLVDSNDWDAKTIMELQDALI